MTERDYLLNEFFALVEQHPNQEEFWGVVLDISREMGVPSSLLFSNEPHILLAEQHDSQDRREGSTPDWANIPESAFTEA